MTHQPARAARRRSIGWLCIGTANVLEQIIKGSFKDMEVGTGQGYIYLNRKEDSHLREARKELVRCEKRLRAVGKNILKGEYGGH